MKKLFSTAALALSTLIVTSAPAASSRPEHHYQNFRVAIYVVVNTTRELADPKTFATQFDRTMRQVPFDKVYVEAYRDHQFATDAQIEATAKAFRDHGIAVSGGVTLAAGGAGGQFGTFDYESPADRAECKKAIELAAKHFDEVILDDFFFYNTKSDADIAAKGNRSWTQYRIDKMREVAKELVLDPAHAVNPKARVIIKYPNWYEHFHGLGFDLDKEAQMFDGIYTGTETRDPLITDQLLQQYESYEIYRYFSNIRPGENGGGWVDPYSTRYVDRYAEQLWDTMFSKAPEITLFNWVNMTGAQPLEAGQRDAWAKRPTTVQWDELVKGYKPAGGKDPGPGWGRAAGYALAQADQAVGYLGKPVGVWSYRPPHASGEDFLHNYLGNIGIPIELSPTFPRQAGTVLLTQAAATDPKIVDLIQEHLKGGHNVVITSGLLKALQGKGIEDIVEIQHTGRIAAIDKFFDGFGAGNGDLLNDPDHEVVPVLFPELKFFTNDSWPVIRGTAGPHGFPILLMNHYSHGTIYVLNIPENVADLYRLPQRLLTKIRSYLTQDIPARIDAPALVSLFAYDNDTYIVQSFRDEPVAVSVTLAGDNQTVANVLRNQPIEKKAASSAPPQGGHRFVEAPRSEYPFLIEPHSFEVLRVIKK